MVGYIILGIIILLAIFVIASYNGMIKMKNSLKEAFSTMDVFMKKRWDLIPNLVETVKGYAKHEKGTLEEIVNLRNGSNYSNLSPEQKIETNTAMGKALTKFFALAENYPELKANENFMNLSNQLNGIENDIANSRKYYNAVVKKYNDKIMVFPSNIIASIFHFTEAQSFEIESNERENVKVEF